MNWDVLKDLAIGLLIGILCGVVPLAIGIFTNKKILGITGIICSTFCGLLFSFLGRSPFTSAVVAILFIIFILLGCKKDAAGEDGVSAEAVSKKDASARENDELFNNDKSLNNDKTDTKN